MKRIESTSNPAIREARRILKAREKERILIESKKLLQEALRSHVPLQEIFITEEIRKAEEDWLLKIEKTGVRVNVVIPSLLKWITDVQTPSGIVGIASRPSYTKWSAPRRFAGCLFSIRDPGNFGTIVRSAEASGCEFLLHTPDCADPFQPKVIRASAGSIFRLPVYEIRQPRDVWNEMRSGNVSLYALRQNGERSIFDTKAELPALLLIGSETKGLPSDIPNERSLRIPMSGSVESLNAAIAAAIAFYWVSNE